MSFRNTRTATCSVERVDATVTRLHGEFRGSMEAADINYRGKIVLLSVSLAALTPHSVVVCCLFEVD